ncbi:hypothetical protein TWF281_007625 [Arthrobotrys megalospora]
MDPISITAGVLSITSSLVTLALKINEIRETLQEASSEIQQLTEEVDSLKLILKQIDEVHSQGGIARNLIEDLATVLQRLNSTVVETDCFLRDVLKKSFRAAFWAFSGKAKSVQFCRRLESYKSTLSMTLVISTISSGRELHGRADQILTGINDIRTHLPRNDDFILQRYLTELETVYEGSTVIGAIEPEEPILPANDQRRSNNFIPNRRPEPPARPVPRPMRLPEIEDPYRSSSSTGQTSYQVFDNHLSGIQGNSQAGHGLTHEAGSDSTSQKTSNEGQSPHRKRPISKIWPSRIRKPKFIIDLNIDMRLTDGIVASSADRFAVFVPYPGPGFEDTIYGQLVFGDIGRPDVVEIPINRGIHSRERVLQFGGLEDPRSHGSIEHLAFQNRDTLVAVVQDRPFEYSDYRQFIVLWRISGMTWSQLWVSPSLDFEPKGSAKSALSAKGRLFSYRKHRSDISVHAVDETWKEILTIKVVPFCDYRDMVFSQNEEKILIFSTTWDKNTKDPLNTYIDIYDIKTQLQQCHVEINELSIEPGYIESKPQIRFFFTGTSDAVLVVGGYATFEAEESAGGKGEHGQKSPDKTDSKISVEKNFCATIDLTTGKISVHNVGPRFQQIYKNPIFAPDGSCFLVTREDVEILSLSSYPGSGRSLYNYASMIKSSSGQRTLRFETSKNRSFGGRWYGMPYTFDDMGRRILILNQVGKGGTQCRLDVWEVS